MPRYMGTSDTANVLVEQTSVSYEKRADCWRQEHWWPVYFRGSIQPCLKYNCHMWFGPMEPGVQYVLKSFISIF